MTIHVVFLVRSLEIGGAERQLATLAAAVQREPGFRASIVTFYPGGALEADVRTDNVELYCPGKAGRWDLAGFSWRLARQLAQLHPTILHSYLGPPNIVAALLRPVLGRGTRIVWGVRAADMDLSRYDWTWRAVFGAERRLSSVPDCIIANSYAGRDHIAAAGFATEHLEVVPNGIDTERFAPDRDAARDLRREWLNGGAGPLIGIVARIDPMKDLETFVRAAALVKDRLPGARFVCVGGGSAELLERLKALANTLGVGDRLTWAGERRDIPRVLNAFDMPTLCSVTEGSPNAVAEAMACGLPCVATSVGDTPDLIGDCGMVVAKSDPAALASAWHAMAALPKAESALLGQRARQRIVENYSRNRMVERTIALYRALIGAGQLAPPSLPRP